MKISKETEEEILKNILRITDQTFDDKGMRILNELSSLGKDTLEKIISIIKFTYLEGTKNGVDLAFVYINNLMENK